LAPTAPTAWPVIAAVASTGDASLGDFLPILLLIISIALHALVSLGVGYLLHRVRTRDKAIDEAFGAHAQRLDRMEAGLADAIQRSVVHDKRIEVLLNREFVPRGECAAFRGEIRDTSTRLFAKVETLQQAAAATAANVESLRQAATGTTAACKTILERLTGPERNP